jgi:DNA-binding SARP family transcriptional activator
MKRTSRLPLHASGALLTLAALAVLWQLRPRLPSLPGSLAAATRPREAEELLFALLWLVVVITLLLIMRALLSHALLVLKLRRQQQIEAFSERVAPAPMPRLTLQPTYADHYAMTLPLQPYSGGREFVPDPTVTEASDSRRRQRGVEAIRPDTRSGLSIAVLGPLEINGAEPIKRAATNEMLAFLALHPAGATRDELTEALWPGQDPQRTQPRLYQSVSDARRAFGNALVREHERYRLDRAAVSIDLDQLHQLLATTGDPDCERHAQEEALSLWRGRPLAGSDFLWAEGFIHELHAALLDLLCRVGAGRLQADDPRGALQAAERAISLDNLHEPSWCLALEADHALGLYNAVTRRYEALAHLLNEQLGLQPSRNTRTIYRQLLSQT